MSDIQIRTMEKAFYLQTKAFLEKNSEHIAEIARLKAEVEWLKEFYDLSVTPNRELQAQVERLTKAGDAMLKAIKVTDHILDWKIELWNAAKEGKPS